MNTIITDEKLSNLREYLATHHIPAGLGNTEEACSIAAINLALTGELTDEIPNCMSRVIGRWIIKVQDAMPDAMRNSEEWKSLLPLAAGTGREHEAERLEIILGWMWQCLEQIQHTADKNGFGEQWRVMCNERTPAAAHAAYAAADAAYAAAHAAAYAAHAAAYAAAYAAADAARAAARAAAEAARAAAYAADFWQKADPAGLLARLIAVGGAL